MTKTYISSSEQETRSLAAEVVEEVTGSKKNRKKALVFGLQGDLGAGKTTFTQALAKALGIRKRILSPTFLVMKRFSTPKGLKFENLYHIDAYRVNSKDLKALGVEKIFKKPNIVVVEWADRVKGILPKDTYWIRFSHGREENERKITLNRR